MKYLISCLFVLLTCAGWAQEVKVETYEYATGLSLDVYLPEDDGTGLRPMMLFVHGGGFSGGSRDSEGVQEFCRSVAAQGIVVSSISYRLLQKGVGFGCDVPAEDKIRVFREAALDASKATAFLLSKAKQWNVSESGIVLAGSSAGAETVLHQAFWPDVRKGSGLSADFSYAGVISFAGAIKDLGLLENANKIPLFLVHGTCDNLVPYQSAPHHYCMEDAPGYLMLHGSGSIARAYQEWGAPYRLYTSCGGNHDWASIPMRTMSGEVSDFILQDVVNKKRRQLHEWLPSEDSCNKPGALVCSN